MATVGLAETTKWWHALDELLFYRRVGGLHMARESQHPDAQWLVSLFPAGEEVTREGMSEVMRGQRGDARAMFMTWFLGG
jgi:hypothetical protein